jgi:hypothetical protein
MWPEDSVPALERQYAALRRALEALPASSAATTVRKDERPLDSRENYQDASTDRFAAMEKEISALKEELANVHSQFRVLREKEKEEAEAEPEAEGDGKDEREDEDMYGSDPFKAVGIPGSFVADFRLSEYPPGTSTKSASPCSAALMEYEKDESSLIFLPQGTYVKCEFGSSLGKIEGPITSYTVSMDVKIELNGTDDVNLSLFSLGWPTPKSELDIIITPEGIVRTPLNEFRQAGDQVVRVPSSKWCRICVTVSDDDKKIATYIDGVPVGTISHSLVNATSGRFSMNPHGFLAFAAEEKMSSPPVRVRRIEVHKKAWSASKVKDACRRHWVLREEVRCMTCMSATQKLKRLSLYGVVSGTRTIPMWRHAAFFAIFTDRCVGHVARQGSRHPVQHADRIDVFTFNRHRSLTSESISAYLQRHCVHVS